VTRVIYKHYTADNSHRFKVSCVVDVLMLFGREAKDAELNDRFHKRSDWAKF